MSNTKQVQKIREQMISIYGEGCWMGYRLDKQNPYTYHHIREARNGGKVTLDNGALLTRLAHDDLNEMENHGKARCLYHALNELFKELNQTRKPPTKEYFKEVNGILLKADKIITLSDHCELNPDFIFLEEFAIATQECYPDIPEVEELRKRISFREEEDVVEIPSYYSPKIKSRNRHHHRNKTKYHYY